MGTTAGVESGPLQQTVTTVPAASEPSAVQREVTASATAPPSVRAPTSESMRRRIFSAKDAAISCSYSGPSSLRAAKAAAIS